MYNFLKEKPYNQLNIKERVGVAVYEEVIIMILK